jgi:hypothetical protein
VAFQHQHPGCLAVERGASKLPFGLGCTAAMDVDVRESSRLADVGSGVGLLDHT